MSIRRRLLIGLLGGLLLLFAISGTFFYFYAKAVLTRQFDAALAAKAHALCNLVKRQPNGELECEIHAESALKSPAADRIEFFQIWHADGSVFMRSAALGKRDLPISSSESDPINTELPRGLPGRSLAIRFVPMMEDEDGVTDKRSPVRTMPDSDNRITVAVAEDRNQLDRVISILISVLLLVAAFMGIGTVAVVSVIVQRGLEPLARVAQEAALIDERSLQFRFPADGLPTELQPICRKLNESLDRLQMAFQRERRFTSDVAHELRTPIAELRSLADVALKWKGDAETSLANFQDANDIAQQMGGIVTALLSLARCQSGAMTVLNEPVDLGDTIKSIWEACKQKAGERNLSVSLDVPSGLLFTTDRTLLLSIFGNLLTNAVEYSRKGGKISCTVGSSNSEIAFKAINEIEFLSADDLPHLREAFWRKDPARTAGSHCGLGLTLVDAYVKLFGGSMSISMPTPDSLCVSIKLPRPKPDRQP